MSALFGFAIAAGTTIVTTAILRSCSTPWGARHYVADDSAIARAKGIYPTEMKSRVSCGRVVKTVGSATVGLTIGVLTSKAASTFQAIFWPYGFIVGGAALCSGIWLEHSWVRFVQHEESKIGRMRTYQFQEGKIED